MDADRQVMPLRRRVDRPVEALAERHVAHRRHEHLHEAPVGRAALDLVDRHFGILQRHHDRRAQPRLAIEPLPRDPIVERLREGRRHVLAEQQVHAVEAIADGDAGAEARERLAAERFEVGSGPAAAAAPIRPRAERRMLRIGDRIELVHAALHDGLAPVTAEIRQQRIHPRYRRMDIAVDAAALQAHGTLDRALPGTAPDGRFMHVPRLLHYNAGGIVSKARRQCRTTGHSASPCRSHCSPRGLR